MINRAQPPQKLIGLDVAIGSLADKPSQAKIHDWPLGSKSDQIAHAAALRICTTYVHPLPTTSGSSRLNTVISPSRWYKNSIAPVESEQRLTMSNEPFA